MSDICQLEADGYCPRHRKRHVGAARCNALDPGPVGRAYRHKWDRETYGGAAEGRPAVAGIFVNPARVLLETAAPLRDWMKRMKDRALHDCPHHGATVREGKKAKVRLVRT